MQPGSSGLGAGGLHVVVGDVQELAPEDGNQQR
jgi:hypothetical protein